jgi:hypothetical protein
MGYLRYLTLTLYTACLPLLAEANSYQANVEILNTTSISYTTQKEGNYQLDLPKNAQFSIDIKTQKDETTNLTDHHTTNDLSADTKSDEITEGYIVTVNFE